MQPRKMPLSAIRAAVVAVRNHRLCLAAAQAHETGVWGYSPVGRRFTARGLENERAHGYRLCARGFAETTHGAGPDTATAGAAAIRSSCSSSRPSSS